MHLTSSRHEYTARRMLLLGLDFDPAIGGTGLHWRLETSDNEVPARFTDTFRSRARTLASARSTVVPTGSEYFGQSFSQFAMQILSIAGGYLSTASRSVADFTITLPGRYDLLLQKIAGDGNDILLWFLRIFVPTLVVLTAVLVVAL